MSKLTEQQIGEIEAALKKVGFLYVDILHEMTDHIAAALEEMEGDFDRNLKLYIGRHKKELLRFNRKYIFAAWLQSYKSLFRNIITIRFVSFSALVYLIVSGLSTVIETESFITIMFLIFCAVNGMLSFPGVYNILKKRDQYSAGEGLAVLNVFVFFPGLFMINFIDKTASDTIAILYFTSLISISAVMGYTLRRLKTVYKLRYNA
ncbi:hypothetical protein [Flavobacterium sp. NRK1]|uniref:hypothetical protein n=1 Tax=Flavobacterium sp. NRK1 TaxID=2954929 RepID=UPI0020931BF8|nr:hypothetical protein [Flavobacterium sp. NRK1]MCO6147667.1 hypothetical protein [Flavobacterium sp. NRK1]